MQRRSFLATSLGAFQARAATPPEATILAYGDGIAHTPQQYAALLAKLTGNDAVKEDDYSRGGVVEALENRVAAMLGKEAAVWLPTGTLANHLAVRLLAGNQRRVLVQAESHLYNDCGDCAQTLSALNLIPLAPGKASFTLDDVEAAVNAGTMGRVATPVGAIQIETPVRRKAGERFDYPEMKRISAWARSRQIGLHLDGARLFIESAYSGHSAAEYAALFDTVYVSMYKYFNAASGAILAGPKPLLDGLYHKRRMFGAGLPQVWPFAAVALHFLDGFEARLKPAVANSERVLQTLSRDANFEVDRVPNGTNIFHLRFPNVNAPIYQGRLETAGIVARLPGGNQLTVQVNETWSRLPADEIYGRFQRALA